MIRPCGRSIGIRNLRMAAFDDYREEAEVDELHPTYKPTMINRDSTDEKTNSEYSTVTILEKIESADSPKIEVRVYDKISYLELPDEQYELRLPSPGLFIYVCWLKMEHYVNLFVEKINRFYELVLGDYKKEECHNGIKSRRLREVELDIRDVLPYGKIHNPDFREYVWYEESDTEDEVRVRYLDISALLKYKYADPNEIIKFLREYPDTKVLCDSLLVYDICNSAGKQPDIFLILSNDVMMLDMILDLNIKAIHLSISTGEYLLNRGYEHIKIAAGNPYNSTLAQEDNLYPLHQCCMMMSKFSDEEMIDWIGTLEFERLSDHFKYAAEVSLFEWMKPMIDIYSDLGIEIVTGSPLISRYFPGVKYSSGIEYHGPIPFSFTPDSSDFNETMILDIIDRILDCLSYNPGDPQYSILSAYNCEFKISVASVYNLIINKSLSEDCLESLKQKSELFRWMIDGSRRINHRNKSAK